MPPAFAVWQFEQIKQHIVENVLETTPLTRLGLAFQREDE